LAYFSRARNSIFRRRIPLKCFASTRHISCKDLLSVDGPKVQLCRLWYTLIQSWIWIITLLMWATFDFGTRMRKDLRPCSFVVCLDPEYKTWAGATQGRHGRGFHTPITISNHPRILWIKHSINLSIPLLTDAKKPLEVVLWRGKVDLFPFVSWRLHVDRCVKNDTLFVDHVSDLDWDPKEIRLRWTRYRAFHQRKWFHFRRLVERLELRDVSEEALLFKLAYAHRKSEKSVRWDMLAESRLQNNNILHAYWKHTWKLLWCVGFNPKFNKAE